MVLSALVIIPFRHNFPQAFSDYPLLSFSQACKNLRLHRWSFVTIIYLLFAWIVQLMTVFINCFVPKVAITGNWQENNTRCAPALLIHSYYKAYDDSFNVVSFPRIFVFIADLNYSPLTRSWCIPRRRLCKLFYFVIVSCISISGKMFTVFVAKHRFDSINVVSALIPVIFPFCQSSQTAISRSLGVN